MDPKNAFAQGDQMRIELDRSEITSGEQIQLPDATDTNHEKSPQQNLTEHAELEQVECRSSAQHIKDSLKQKKQDAGNKIRRSLHISKESSDLATSHSPVLVESTKDKSRSRLNESPPIPAKPTVKDFIHNPVDTIKAKVYNQRNYQVAATLATKEIPHGQEVDLVNASDAVDRARSENERLLAIRNLSDLLKERQNTYARWTLDRHVTKIRVSPRDSFVRKTRAHFERRNEKGEMVVDWNAYRSHLLDSYAHWYGGQYIGYGSYPPTPCRETIMQNIERLIVSSSAFQQFLMTTRRVYRWKNRRETTKYLVIYFTLWYLNLLLPGILSAILYFVTVRRVHGNTIEDLREDITRKEDIQRTALSLTELIDKVGEEQWPDNLLERVGPWFMMQLADISNFFESVQNFYEWRNPARTVGLMIVLSMAIIITTFVPAWLLLKSFTLGAGIAFFGLFPIAVNFPEYRLLISPCKRLLWNIPTHAEWAIMYFQAEGARVAANMQSSSSTQAQDCGSYKAHHNKCLGNLVLTADSVQFISTVPHAPHFTLSYAEINNLEKINHILSKNMPKKLARDSRKDLKIVDKAEREWILEDVDRRDEAFSQILGFSKTAWQVMW